LQWHTKFSDGDPEYETWTAPHRQDPEGMMNGFDLGNEKEDLKSLE